MSLGGYELSHEGNSTYILFCAKTQVQNDVLFRL